jgi:muconolactone delta-isomerase
MSADAAERQGASERQAARELQEQYLHHLLSATGKSHVLKLRRGH